MARPVDTKSERIGKRPGAAAGEFPQTPAAPNPSLLEITDVQTARRSRWTLGPWSSSSANPFRKLQVHVTEELQEV